MCCINVCLKPSNCNYTKQYALFMKTRKGFKVCRAQFLLLFGDEISFESHTFADQVTFVQQYSDHVLTKF